MLCSYIIRDDLLRVNAVPHALTEVKRRRCAFFISAVNLHNVGMLHDVTSFVTSRRTGIVRTALWALHDIK